MALIGAIGGGALRLVPEFMAVYVRRSDTDAEIRLAEVELERERMRGPLDSGAAAQSEPHAAAREERVVERTHAGAPARWIEAGVTFWLLAIYTAYKVAFVCLAARENLGTVELAPLVWGDDDWTIFSGIVTYWFIDRTLSARGSAR